MQPVTLPCSDASRARAEPLLATASRVQRWVLVEQCGPWGPPTLPVGRMDAELAAHLTAEAARTGARLLLLRHPPGVLCPQGRQVFVVESQPGRERMLHRHFDDDAELLATHLPGADADGWLPADGPLLLVCTHGRHDRCCAVRGRPVAEALAARWPERTWECSHVGGDRFAANLVVMPEGWYFGQLEPAEAVDAVAGLRQGRLPVGNLRGRSSVTLPVQAAQYFARTALGRDAVDDLQLVRQRDAGPDTWTVLLAGVGGLPDIEVLVHYDRTAEPQLLTCDADEAKVAPRFDCLALTALAVKP